MLHIYFDLLSHLQIAKYKGFHIKIQVFTGFSAKLKVLKDFNKIKVFKGFKGSPRGPALLIYSVQGSLLSLKWVNLQFSSYLHQYSQSRWLPFSQHVASSGLPGIKN